MDIDLIINNSIDKGEVKGLEELVGYERIVFLISEAETYCDMEGIDSLFDKYDKATILELIEGYKKIGAHELSNHFMSLINSETANIDYDLGKLNDMITSRHGYDYDSIKNWLRRELEN